MVAKKLDRDTLLDLYLLYHDVNQDLTIQYLADKVGISRSRLGKLFKRVDPHSLEVDYDNDNLDLSIIAGYLQDGITLTSLAKKYRLSKSTLYRKFNKLKNDN